MEKEVLAFGQNGRDKNTFACSLKQLIKTWSKICRKIWWLHVSLQKKTRNHKSTWKWRINGKGARTTLEK